VGGNNGKVGLFMGRGQWQHKGWEIPNTRHANACQQICCHFNSAFRKLHHRTGSTNRVATNNQQTNKQTFVQAIENCCGMLTKHLARPAFGQHFVPPAHPVILGPSRFIYI